MPKYYIKNSLSSHLIFLPSPAASKFFIFVAPDQVQVTKTSSANPGLLILIANQSQNENPLVILYILKSPPPICAIAVLLKSLDFFFSDQVQISAGCRFTSCNILY